MLLGRYTHKMGWAAKHWTLPKLNLYHLLQDVKRKMQYMLKAWLFLRY